MALAVVVSRGKESVSGRIICRSVALRKRQHTKKIQKIWNNIVAEPKKYAVFNIGVKINLQLSIEASSVPEILF